MAQLFLVRHAESEWNAQGRWQGQGDPPLSERGRDEAARAAHRLRELFDGGPVVASSLRRALETAEIIAAELGLHPLHVEPELREVAVGEWTGLTRAEIEERFPAEWAALGAGTLEGFPGGETRRAFGERVVAALERLTEQHRGRRVLVVTHGGAIHALERWLDVHPGATIGNLVGRWFELGVEPRATSERIPLLETSVHPTEA